MSAKRFAFMICGLAGFLIIAYFVKNYGVTPFDSLICGAVYSLRRPALTYLLTVITYLGNWQAVTVICLALLISWRTRKAFGYPLAFAASMSVVIYEILKAIFKRARPDEALRLIHETGFSFPSGHSMTSLVFYGLAIYLINRKLKNKMTAKILTVILSGLIILIGFSRIYLGVHYPTDVLGGFCTGAALLSFVLFCNDAYEAPVKKDAL